MTKEQRMSKQLIEITRPVEIDLAYHIYLMEWVNLNKN